MKTTMMMLKKIDAKYHRLVFSFETGDGHWAANPSDSQDPRGSPGLLSRPRYDAFHAGALSHAGRYQQHPLRLETVAEWHRVGTARKLVRLI